MSVVIKDMKIPKNCCECEIRSYDADTEEERCPFSQIECLSTGRQDDCPLVELPDNHGDLIDRNKLELRVALFEQLTGVKLNQIHDFVGSETVVFKAEGE